MSDRKEYRYEKLTWPEIDAAVARSPVCLLPVGSVEQHGPHLPLDVDIVCPKGIADGAGREIPDKLLVLPPFWYGYTGHVMDFPGTINTDYSTMIEAVLDITRSLAYHGFKKIILFNGHGSNVPVLDLVSRRTNLETDAECALLPWWSLLTVDKAFLPGWRESSFPGGIAHACELETSLYMYLDGDHVRRDLIRDGAIRFNLDKSPFMFVDLFGSGPMSYTPYTSSYSESGVFGEPEMATPAKGERVYLEAVQQLVSLVSWWKERPKDPRVPRHATPPTMPMPWKQQSMPRS